MYTKANRRTSQEHYTEWLVMLCVSAVLFGPVVRAQEDNNTPGSIEQNAPSRVALNFQDVPLQTVLEYLSETAGLVVVCDEPLNGRVTVISRQPVDIGEAISVINSVLKERDLAAVRTGRTLRVVTLAKAKTMNLPVTSGNDPNLITPADDIVTHVASVRYLDAAKLKENLQSLIPEYASLEANQEGNALIITDTTANIKRLMQIIRALDTHMATVSEIRVFHLKSADARNTAELINKIFQPEQASTRMPQSPRDMMRMMMSRRRRGRDRDSDEEQQQTEGWAGARVVAAADERTNSVVVSGSADTMGVVAQMVEALDSRSAAVSDVKVFHLEYADAENAAQLINEVFGKDRDSSRSRSSGSDFPVSFRRGRFGRSEPEQTTESEKSGGIVEVVAAADRRTNSIVVSGPSDTLEVIAVVIKELDADPEQERQIFIYALKNADAANLKEILNSLFTEMQSLEQEGGAGSSQRFQGQAAQRGQSASRAPSSSANGDLSEEAYFEADESTNSLLVMTSPKNYEKIKPIIEQLDRRLGQVLIKVLFAEITHTDALDLGMEFSVLNLRSDGDSTLFSTDFGIAAESGGLIIRAVEGDLTATLRALQEVGKLDILSRPYVLTRDNQTATINVGERVPFITNTRTTETGQTINTIQYDDIGIILEVTPSINPEGLVIMDVKPEISAITPKTVPISETVDAAVFANRSSQTRVEVRDGQTIVIGGLVEDQLSENVEKVPLLGDIPLAGLLFRRTAIEKTKRELLIFLTPYVAIDDEKLTAISETEKGRSTLEHGGFGTEVFQKHMESMKGTLDLKTP